MEESSIENQEELLSFDSIAREQLSEAARWARFLAIMGFRLRRIHPMLRILLKEC